MKKIFVFAIVLLTTSIAYAQINWVTHKVDERISVKFPSEPKEIIAGTFAVRDKDSIGYIVTVIDFMKIANIDSVALAPMKATPEFAGQLKAGILSKLHNVDLDDFKITTWMGFTSYTTSGVDQKKKRYDMFMVIIGNKLYSFSTVTPADGAISGREAFLASIQVSN